MIVIKVYRDEPNSLGLVTHKTHEFADGDSNIANLLDFYEKADPQQKVFVVRTYRIDADGKINFILRGQV